MNVICIDSSHYNLFLNVNISAPVHLGNTYEVANQEEHYGKPYYNLKGYAQCILVNADCFLPCSELDEMELINHPIRKKK